ncbi:Cof-type HAD-IIB family hydrolase [Enterococcus rivorum]|uniref:HAD family hydrolase n=1 Tax=Enterococcus rivorum TaxID=762845 RepID=A0A1E5KT31_9ENTE|nr:Cof-type HAD-IIB family hydrolase [Enterococcus rivorum]MBP2098071.1 Cof subfamily protein (haloacid dehalogenase superfamily) [Enterococcus rivorum]OEH81016.1 hypothetical protein BCR26_05745 [Enterococcus rivorum]
MNTQTRFKLLALDMDGTTLNSNHTLSEKTIESINSFAKQGVKVVFATGRMPSAVEEHLTRVDTDGLVVTHNGALVKNMKTDKVLLKKTIREEVIKAAIDFSRKSQTQLHLNLENRTVIENESSKSNQYAEELRISLDLTENFNRISERPVSLLLINRKTVLEEFLESCQNSEYLKFDYVLIPWSNEEWMLQLLPENTSKGQAVIDLSEQLNIDPKEEVISFGDSYNDLEMIAGTFLGVAMDNACDELKKVANYVTKSNDSDGVAYVLDKLMLNETNFVSNIC